MAEDLERLRARQQDVLALVAEGMSNKEIALILGISRNTVKSYVEEILAIWELPNRAAAGARWAAAQARGESNRLNDPPGASPAE